MKRAMWSAALNISVLASVFLGGPAMAVEVDPRELVVRSLTRALLEAPEVRSAQADLQAAGADVDAAEFARYPKFELGVSGSNGDPPSRNNPATQVDRRVSASLRWTLWDFGKSGARQRSVEFGRQAAMARVDQARLEFLRQLLTAYVEISRYELLVEVGRSSRDAMQELERLEDKRVRLGGAGITDARLAASRLAQSVNKSLQFEQGLQQARLRLEALLGTPLPQQKLPPLRVPPPWLSVAGGSIEAEIDQSVSLRAQRLNLDQARADIEMEESSQYPAVDLTLIKRYEYPGTYSDKSRVGLQITTGTAAALEASTRIQRANSRLLSEEQKLLTMRREALQKAQGGLQRISLSDQRVQMLSSASGDANAVVDSRKKLNQAGRGTTLALLDAQVESNNTLIDWVQALHDQRVTEIELAADIGRLLPETGRESTWFADLLSDSDYRSDIRQRLAGQPTAGARLGDLPSPGAGVVLKDPRSFRIGLSVPAAPSRNTETLESGSAPDFFRMDVKLNPSPGSKRWW